MTAPGYRERGIAALEMVVVLLLGVLLLAGLVLFGRLTMHMIVMEKAVGSTARIMATLPRKTLTAGDAYVRLPLVGGQMVYDMAVSAGLDTVPSRAQVAVLCDELYCGPGVSPTLVSVGASIRFKDPVFPGFTSELLPVAGSLSLTFKYSEPCAPINLPTP